LHIKLNNQLIPTQSSQTLAEFLVNHGHTQTHFAVALNQHFVPRSLHAQTYLQDGDCIEIVAPMQGG
jgi:sulfur carrier protein